MSDWMDILKKKKKKKPKSPRKRALERARKKGLSGLNDPQALRDDKSKSHHVMAWDAKSKKAKAIKKFKKTLIFSPLKSL